MNTEDIETGKDQTIINPETKTKRRLETLKQQKQKQKQNEKTNKNKNEVIQIPDNKTLEQQDYSLLGARPKTSRAKSSVLREANSIGHKDLTKNESGLMPKKVSAILFKRSFPIRVKF